MGRWLRFFVIVSIGAAAAMYYGWRINPVKYTETTPETLRADYKTDYVLMVAEAYRVEGDLNLAARRLALIGNDSPTKIVADAILEAVKIQYPPGDLAMMQNLADALKTWNPLSEGPAP
jgi:hypothetical protein